MTDIPTVVAHVTHLERGADAIRIADQFATRARGGRLYVTHVVPAMPDAMRDILFPYACFGADEVDIEAELIQHAGKRAVQTLKGTYGPDLRDALRVGYGPHNDTADAMLAELGPDVVVAHRPDDLRLGLLSREADALVRRARVPVVLAREVSSDAAEIRSIAVAYDLTLESRTLLETAIRWASRMGAQVTPIAVASSPTVGDHAGLWGEAKPLSKRSRGSMEKLDLQWRSTMELEFPQKRELEERLNDTVLLAGDAVDAVLEAASAADLLVVGRARPGRPAGSFGRVASALASRAPMHVAVVPL